MSTEVPPIQVSHTIDQPTSTTRVGRSRYSLASAYFRMPSGIGDEVAQDRQEVRHRFASAGIAAFDAAQRDARLRHVVGLTHQLGEPLPTQVTRPPQADSCADRSLDVVIAERHRCAPHARFDLDLKARRSLTLPPTHPPTITRGGRAEPRPHRSE